MATRKRRSTKKQEEPKVEEAPKRTEPITHVVEYGLREEEAPLLDGLKATEAEMIKHDVLYLTVPKGSYLTNLTAWLLETFEYVGPLNVGTNPRLKSNDTRTRDGFLCVK
jgi:hypothetical protein